MSRTRLLHIATAATACAVVGATVLVTARTVAVAGADSDKLAIVDKPIKFDAERKRLTIEYRQIHQDPNIDHINIVPKMVVVHYTGGNSASGTWRYFNRTRLEGARQKLKRAGAVNVSAHFIVDRDGSVTRLLPETTMGRHTIGLNHLAIGIENVGDGKRHKLTGKQLDANAKLIKQLARRHNITHVIGHHESMKMEATPLWLERDPKYRNRKPDPGPAFMARLRVRLRGLGLKGPP